MMEKLEGKLENLKKKKLEVLVKKQKIKEEIRRTNFTEMVKLKSINNVGVEMIGRSIKIKKLQGNTFEIFEEK